MLYTNEVLVNLHNNNIMEAMAWVKTNFERMGGFFTDNSYQKIPRDALRVSLLALISKINEDLIKQVDDGKQILMKLLYIHHGLRLLDKADPHRTQIAHLLKDNTLANGQSRLT
jgi:hypothetical protein